MREFNPIAALLFFYVASLVVVTILAIIGTIPWSS